MKNPKNSYKLVLRTEVVRTLRAVSQQELARVAGGSSSEIVGNCSAAQTCPTN